MGKFRMKAAILAAAGASLLASPIATAQSRADYDAQRGYDRDDRGPPPRPDDDYDYYDESYERGPPAGYDGTQPPPPPRGWSADPDQQRFYAEDDRFAEQAERWAQGNCVRAQNNTAAGAIVGGLIGALIGNGTSRPRDRTGGTLAGAAIGAAGGAVVGSATSNQTSPGCPPGFVVRGGAPAFAYGPGFAPGFAYAAPGWYRPWVFAGNRWVYRPYPYHRFYRRHYVRPNGWRRPPGYRPGPVPRPRPRPQPRRW